MNIDFIYWCVWALSWYGIYQLKKDLDLSQQAVEKQIELNKCQLDINRATKTEIVRIHKMIKELQGLQPNDK